MILNKEQICQFNEEGYLVLENLFSEDEILNMQLESVRILELIINSSLYHHRTSGRLDLRKSQTGLQSIRKIQPVNDLSLFFSKICSEARFMQPLSQLMGEKPVLMEEKLNYKQTFSQKLDLTAKGETTNFPVHSDYAYYKHNHYPKNIISSALTLDASTKENGPLRIWPGSHTKEHQHEQGHNGYEVVSGSVNYESGQDIIVPAGTLIFFHSMLVHSSRANETDSPRRIMIYSHYPESAKLGHDIRNGPLRLKEAPWEWQYINEKLLKGVDDNFSVTLV